MSDELRHKRAREIYDRLCAAVDEKGWSCTKREDDLVVRIVMFNEERQISLRVSIDEEYELVRLFSMMPSFFTEERGAELAVIACAANNRLQDGYFTSGGSTGRIFYKWAFCYTGCEPGPELFIYMVEYACAAIDRYGKIFYSLMRNRITLEQAVEQVGNQPELIGTSTGGAIGKNTDKAYAALCSAMERGDLHFRKYGRIPVLRFHVEDEGPSKRFAIRFNRVYELITLSSTLPLHTPEARRIEMAVAVCRATGNLLNGCFGYNLADGTLSFRLTAPLRGCEYSEGFFACMVEDATEMVHEFTDRFGKLATGVLSLPEFLNMI